MNIVLIGATGYVGSQILTEALNRNHKVTAVARHANKISITSNNIIIRQCDILKQNETIEIIKGHEAVISAYNPGWKNPDIYDEYIRGYKSILESMHKTGVKRIIIIGGAGSLYVKPGLQLVDSPEFPDDWKQGALAARQLYNTIQNEDELKWTFVSPAAQLVPGDRTGEFRYGENDVLFNEKNESKISVQDLAVAVLNELENPSYIKKRFTVTY